jgi:hypothetical protein
MIESTSNNDLLNWAQRNSVSITLRDLEMGLRHAQEVLAKQEQGILYEYTAFVSVETMAQLEQEINPALQEIVDLAGRLDLVKSPEPNRRLLMSQLSVLWADLHDMRVGKLARYGETSPELDEVLTPALTRLIQHVEKMMSLLSEDKGNLHAEP